MSGSDTDLPVILWDFSDPQAEQDCACAGAGLAPAVLWPVIDEAWEDDCACSGPKVEMALHRRVERPMLWQCGHDQRRMPVTDTHELVFNSLGPVSVAVLNPPALDVLEAYRQPLPLTDTTSCRLAAIGLLQPVDASAMPIPSGPKTLTAWLHVTNACNLRCTYCYVSKTDEAMDEETGLAAIGAVFRSATRHGFKAIKLKYAGGEATLNLRLIRLLHGYAAELAAHHGLDLHEVILSNGVALSNALLDFVRDSGLRLMISLDGLGPDHDAQRVFSNGRGSSQHVVRGVDRALARGVRPYLSITVTTHNADGIASTVAFALERELPFNLNFYRENGHGTSHEKLLGEDAQLIAGVRAAFRVIEEKLPRQSPVATLLDRSSFVSPHKRPCGAGQNYLVIDHHGRVAHCQMDMQSAVTDITEQDPLEVIRLQATGFRNLPVDEKEGCRDCQWRYWCAGGCPLLTYRTTGRSDVRSPYCNVYRTLFPELLRLEGLRLLKWASQIM